MTLTLEIAPKCLPKQAVVTDGLRLAANYPVHQANWLEYSDLSLFEYVSLIVVFPTSVSQVTEQNVLHTARFKKRTVSAMLQVNVDTNTFDDYFS